MPENQVTVADDWTKNWHAKIAVKITAIVLWGIVLSSFAVMVAQLANIEADLVKEYAEKLDHIAAESVTTLQQMKAFSVDELTEEMHTSVTESVFLAVEIAVNDQKIVFGERTDQLISAQRTFIFQYLNQLHYDKVTITGFYPPIKKLITFRRNNVVMLVGIATAIFGAFLMLVIQLVFNRPIQLLVQTTRIVSEGNLDIRLKAIRQDEFGHLSQFFNEMLDGINKDKERLDAKNLELKKYGEKLETRVNERTADLAIARDEALRASQTKSAFLANMSHEIRTPLTAIIGFAESLKDSNQPLIEREDAIDTIVRNGRHLLDIINDILDLSKIEAERLDVEELAVSPYQLIKEVEALAGMQAREKKLILSTEYQFPLPKTIYSDPTRLKQILLNLCSNAIKFTDQGKIRLILSCDVAHEKLIFTIIDSGIGMSESQIKKLFRAFSQADSTTTRKYGGTGLGLHISMRLVEMLGGKINVKSIPDIGSRFNVEIKTGSLDGVDMIHHLNDIQTTEKSASIRLPEENRTRAETIEGHILLAEDTKDNQKLISLFIRTLGANLTIVENGMQAIDATKANHYDLILMDIHMPIMNGMEATKKIRMLGYEKPIIALTANVMKDDIAEYIQAGCTDHIAKPIDKDKFFNIVRAYLSK